MTKSTGTQVTAPTRNFKVPSTSEIEKALKDAAISLDKAKTKLILEQPFFGMIALQMRNTPALDMPTLATDGRRLFYNPFYVELLNNSQLVSAVAHECMHMALSHTARLQGRDAGKWNAAGDYAINILLRDSGFELGEGWLHDEKWRGEAEDIIYKNLPDSPTSPPGQCGSGEDGDGNGQPLHGEGHKDGHGCGGLRPLRNEDGSAPTEDEIAQHEAEGKILVSQAAAMAKQAGKLPAGLERFIDDFIEPKVRWQDQLRLYVEQSARNDYSWTRPNLRHIGRGFYLPTLYNQELECLAIAVDTSGSVSQMELKQFAGELQSILETVNLGKIYVIYCDAQVEGVAEFTKDDFPLPLKAFNAVGGGGTSFEPPFTWLDHEGISPTVMIYMTDMYCSDYAPEPEYPVIWLSTEQGDPHWTNKAPYGEAIQIEFD